MVKFNARRKDADKITAIVKKVSEVMKKSGGPDVDHLEVRMSLTACHLNGCPLDLDKLAAADDFNLLHDVIGIHRHVSRDTGELTDHFRPRCAARIQQAA
ncbi:hypothetical protein D3877_19940 [Azospirillum cavernae]|uniref:DUF6874 domain-containing protein n=1 Tax=Azospirillum cavernae TaxID=2320860 RepID=A0A418VYX3_9PROT|nr:hypothetical protein [Azospirillum cavernae]RJF82315.1 hypothetical protein D3877_19940 [Azospirillum cavernae]